MSTLKQAISKGHFAGFFLRSGVDASAAATAALHLHTSAYQQTSQANKENWEARVHTEKEFPRFPAPANGQRTCRISPFQVMGLKQNVLQQCGKCDFALSRAVLVWAIR